LPITAINPEILKKPTANGSAAIVLSRRDVIGIIPKIEMYDSNYEFKLVNYDEIEPEVVRSAAQG